MDVILHLTHDCQLDCVYCYSGRKRGDAMSADVARRAIDLVFDQAVPEGSPPPQIAFFGGEPLLEWDLVEGCIAYAESRTAATGNEFRLTMTTNGLGLDDAKATFLKQKNVDTVLSFDGVREAQDACRRYGDGRASFDDSERALRLLLGHFPDLMICAVVSPENVRHVPASIDFFLDAGIRRLVLNPNFFAEWDEEHLDAWRRGYGHAALRFEEAYDKGVPLNIAFITAKIITHLKGGYDPCDCCDFGRKEIAVAPSGNIYPCQRMVGEDTEALGLLGNVFDGINPGVAKEIIECGTVRSPECEACDLRRRCRNWCSCVNHALTGRFDRVGALVCFHERMAISIADRVASRLFKKNNEAFLKTFYSADQIAPEWV